MTHRTTTRGCRIGRLLFSISGVGAMAGFVAGSTPFQAPAQATADVPGTFSPQPIAEPRLTLDPTSEPAQGEPENLQEINRKLSNPVSDVWALFTEFDLFFSGGDINHGGDEVGGRMILQPLMPVPLYGQGKDEWKLISRPTLPILFSQPVPFGFEDFTHLGGLGDLQIPTMIAPPTGKVIFGLGPGWLFPTATRPEFGRQQWGVGPAGVFGYANRRITAVVMPQYYFGIGGWGEKRDASYMSLLYAFIYHLPGGWDIGTNPMINYDHTASPGNRWNVPVGLFVGKMVKIGKTPVKFQLGMEYSVVREDDFGQRAQIRFNVIPVIPSLIKRPVFGGS